MENPWDDAWHHPFAGVLAQHSIWQRPLIELVLSNHRVSGIFELGTAKGALSTYLGLCGIWLNVPVFTFDCSPPDPVALRQMRVLGVMFKQCDVFSEETQDYILSQCKAPVYMICDNGNKPLEVQNYSRKLPVGSVISAHDWGVEIGPQDIAGLPLAPFEPELWRWKNAQFATWIVEGEYGEEVD